jgi:hypothetical protein
MDYHGLVKSLDLPGGWAPPTDLAHDDIRARAISRADLDNDVMVLRSEANSREGSCRSSAAFLPGLWSPAALGSALIRRTSTYERLAPWTAGAVQRALSSLASREWASVGDSCTR